MRHAKYFVGSVSFTALAYYLFGSAADNNTNNAFGSMYKWKNLHEGFEEAKLSRKPIFLLIHKPGCPTCEKLKPKFINSLRLLDLSKQFVMVDAIKNEISAQDEARFQPDGTYVPRILFFTPDGEFMKDIYNPKADKKYKYFYSKTSHIIDSMLLALESCNNLSDKSDRNS